MAKKLTTKKQSVSQPDNWLTYKEPELEESVQNRQFAKVIFTPDAAPAWDEWTAQQYDAWQAQYNPQPEPEPQPEEAQIVE